MVPRDPKKFLLNLGSARAGAFVEADHTREGDDYIGVVQAVRGLSGHDEAIPGQALRVGVSHGAGEEPKYGVNFSLVHPNTP